MDIVVCWTDDTSQQFQNNGSTQGLTNSQAIFTCWCHWGGCLFNKDGRIRMPLGMPNGQSNPSQWHQHGKMAWEFISPLVGPLFWNCWDVWEAVWVKTFNLKDSGSLSRARISRRTDLLQLLHMRVPSVTSRGSLPWFCRLRIAISLLMALFSPNIRTMRLGLCAKWQM